MRSRQGLGVRCQVSGGESIELTPVEANFLAQGLVFMGRRCLDWAEAGAALCEKLGCVFEAETLRNAVASARAEQLSFAGSGVDA